jgi:hypothetical protein
MMGRPVELRAPQAYAMDHHSRSLALLGVPMDSNSGGTQVHPKEATFKARAHHVRVDQVLA